MSSGTMDKQGTSEGGRRRRTPPATTSSRTRQGGSVAGRAKNAAEAVVDKVRTPSRVTEKETPIASGARAADASPLEEAAAKHMGVSHEWRAINQGRVPAAIGGILAVLPFGDGTTASRSAMRNERLSAVDRPILTGALTTIEDEQSPRGPGGAQSFESRARALEDAVIASRFRGAAPARRRPGPTCPRRADLIAARRMRRRSCVGLLRGAAWRSAAARRAPRQQLVRGTEPAREGARRTPGVDPIGG